MPRATTWIFGLLVGVASFHMYARRADTGDLPGGRTAGAPPGIELSTTVEGPGGDATEGTPSKTTPKKGQAPRPEAPPKAAPAADPLPEGAIDGAATALATTQHQQALDLLASGEEAKGALLLFRVTRARTNAPEREDAAKRLAAIEKGALERAAKAKAAGALEEERAALSTAYLACLDAARRAPLKARLDELASDLVFSSRASGVAHSHTVRSGESLVKVAATYNFPAEGIQRVNKLKSTGLRVGERLKVPKGPVEILVVKSEFRVALLFNGMLAKEFSAGLGKDGCTPEASFTIDTKLEKPTYYAREGTFPFGHEKNILGTRWLGFKNTDEHKGFGIHGTAFPESIGKEASSGCVRLRNEDVEDLFGWVPKNTSVVIVR